MSRYRLTVQQQALRDFSQAMVKSCRVTLDRAGRWHVAEQNRLLRVQRKDMDANREPQLLLPSAS